MMMTINNTQDLAEAIKRLRTANNLTLSELSDASGVARNTIYNIENCRNVGSLDILFKLLNSLNATMTL